MKADVYSLITNRIIAELEQGARPWHKPWESGDDAISRPLRSTGEPYNGINVIMLWMTAMERGYSAPLWMTYRQAASFGANVRKGEKGTLVIYANTFTRKSEEEGNEEEERIPFIKGYTVFNVEQIDGLPERFYNKNNATSANPDQLAAHADGFFTTTGAKIRHGWNAAYYNPLSDIVQMPSFESFHNAVSYYGVLSHEMTHWTGHKTRLARDLSNRFGEETKSMEELVAELGAAFLCADLGLEPQVKDTHAPYIAHWLQVMKSDKKAIFTAASTAQQAVDFLHDLQSVQKAVA